MYTFSLRRIFNEIYLVQVSLHPKEMYSFLLNFLTFHKQLYYIREKNLRSDLPHKLWFGWKSFPFPLGISPSFCLTAIDWPIHYLFYWNFIENCLVEPVFTIFSQNIWMTKILCFFPFPIGFIPILWILIFSRLYKFQIFSNSYRKFSSF